MRNTTLLFQAICLSFAITQANAQVSFQELTNLPFLDSQSYLNGVSWVDVDNDNDLDVCVTGFGGAFPNFVNVSAVFINDGAGNFSNNNLLASTQKNPMRHAWADIDNDNDLDLYIGATWNSNGINELWVNNGGASLALTPNSGATPNVAQPYEGTVSWADYNNDGWVDLFVPRWNDLKNKLYRNTGNGAFAEVTAGAIVNDLAWTSGGFWGDYDNDRDQDLFVVNYQIGPTNPGTNDLFRNNGDGTFSKITTAGQITTLAQNGRSANWVDVNNDGFLDLFVCNQFGQDLLHRNNGDGTFTTQMIGGTNHTSWSSNWGDFDNDGDQDLITIGFWSTDSRIWENDGHGNLTDATANFPNVFPSATNGSNSNGVIWVDYDLDGWLDLHVTQPDVAADHFYRNLGTACKSWLEVKCAGQQSNHAAIGATLRAKANINGNAVWQMRQISSQTAATGTNPMWQHFGFDEAGVIDSLVVEWPSGKTCIFAQVAVNQFIEIREDCTIAVIKAAPASNGASHAIALCAPATDSIPLVPAGAPGGTWTAANCSNCVTAAGIFIPFGLPEGEYRAYYQQGNACTGSTDTFIITIHPQPELMLSGKDTVEYGEAVHLQALLATGAADIHWTPSASLNCSNCPNPVFTADTTTLFTVTGINAFGCADTATLLILVNPKQELKMPNAFSPNGDQSNDLFRPAYKANNYLDYNLRVFSRWGERIFESFNIGDAWDGTINGLPAPSDVYLYIFEYKLKDGTVGYKKGEVTLIR